MSLIERRYGRAPKVKGTVEEAMTNDFTRLTPISGRDEKWQEAVLVALTKSKPARAFTHRYVEPVIAALLELTF